MVIAGASTCEQSVGCGASAKSHRPVAGACRGGLNETAREQDI